MSELVLKYNPPLVTKLDNFEKYGGRSHVFIVHYKLFHEIKNVKGSNVEC